MMALRSSRPNFLYQGTRQAVRDWRRLPNIADGTGSGTPVAELVETLRLGVVRGCSELANFHWCTTCSLAGQSINFLIWI